MYTNDYMYAIERNDEYLAHFGVKGMRWGVRKARETGNSRRLGRMYKKAAKKLAKLEKRAASGKKYARRAAALGAGAAVAGGAAALGTAGVGGLIRRSGNAVSGGSRLLGRGLTAGGRAVSKVANFIPGKQLGMSKVAGRVSAAGKRMEQHSGAAGQGLRSAGTNLAAWGGKRTIGKGIGNSVSNAVSPYTTKLLKKGNAESYLKAGHIGNKVDAFKKSAGGISNNTYARIAAGAVGAGLAGAAGYNAYRAATTKRAAKKAAAWKSEMNKAFAGTQYSNGGGNRQGKKRKRR